MPVSQCDMVCVWHSDGAMSHCLVIRDTVRWCHTVMVECVAVKVMFCFVLFYVTLCTSVKLHSGDVCHSDSDVSHCLVHLCGGVIILHSGDVCHSDSDVSHCLVLLCGGVILHSGDVCHSDSNVLD